MNAWHGRLLLAMARLLYVPREFIFGARHVGSITFSNGEMLAASARPSLLKLELPARLVAKKFVSQKVPQTSKYIFLAFAIWCNPSKNTSV